MIQEIQIISKNATIPAGYKLGLKKMTIINGANNSGKTNFMCALDDPKKVQFFDENSQLIYPNVVYVAADNIKPSENEARSSAKTTNLIKNFSKLFSNLKVEFKLEGHDRVVDLMKKVTNQTSNNLRDILDDETYRINIENSELDEAVIIQSLIKNIDSYEGEEKRKLDELGQGTQRMIIVSILKAYIDVLTEEGTDTDRPVLILIEEPEIYLHPRWKRALNSVLQRIVKLPNHQIIISTHDPYFVFKNFVENDVRVVFFTKNTDGMTEPAEDGVCGIEDELLFIFLYGCLLDKIERGEIQKNEVEKTIVGEIASRRDQYICNQNIRKPRYDLEFIRDQIHHLGDNKATIGLVYKVPADANNVNYFLEEELGIGIKAMSDMLVKVKTPITG